MNPPIVSVCMAVYNADRYLRAAIESILNQTFTDFEFLIIDDGSIDQSLSIIEKYACQDERIHWRSHHNLGVPKVRNELLTKARGEFIAVMDADDISLPNRLACQVRYLQGKPQCVWLGGSFELIDKRGWLLANISMMEKNSEIQELLLKGQTNFLHPTAMIRKLAMESVGGYNPEFQSGSDLDLWLKLSETGELANLSETVLRYRIHDHSISSRQQEQQWANASKIFDQAWARRKLTRDFAVTGCGWRPLESRDSQFSYMLRYGWWAFNSGQRHAALYYGFRSALLFPFSLETWKLLICAVLKPLPSMTL